VLSWGEDEGARLPVRVGFRSRSLPVCFRFDVLPGSGTRFAREGRPQRLRAFWWKRSEAL